jgi:hypothetical protein
MGPPLNGIDYLLLALLGFVPATGSARRRGGRTALQAGQIGACRRGRRSTALGSAREGRGGLQFAANPLPIKPDQIP